MKLRFYNLGLKPVENIELQRLALYVKTITTSYTAPALPHPPSFPQFNVVCGEGSRGAGSYCNNTVEPDVFVLSLFGIG